MSSISSDTIAFVSSDSSSFNFRRLISPHCRRGQTEESCRSACRQRSRNFLPTQQFIRPFFTSTDKRGKRQSKRKSRRKKGGFHVLVVDADSAYGWVLLEPLGRVDNIHLLVKHLCLNQIIFRNNTIQLLCVQRRTSTSL